MPLPELPQPIAIADHGAATGYNSLLPIGAAITVLRTCTRADHAILVAAHTDLPDNDFTALFTTLTGGSGQLPGLLTRPPSPPRSGRSFYQQILPSEKALRLAGVRGPPTG